MAAKWRRGWLKQVLEAATMACRKPWQRERLLPSIQGTRELGKAQKKGVRHGS